MRHVYKTAYRTWKLIHKRTKLEQDRQMKNRFLKLYIKQTIIDVTVLLLTLFYLGALIGLWIIGGDR